VIFGMYTLSDIKLNKLRVFLRVDINSPIDPDTGKFLDTSRIKAVKETLKELEDCSVVLASHQSRPGKGDFTSLERHAEILSKYVSQDVEFIPDIFGPYAIDRIKKLKPGEIIVLDNLRYYSEENLEFPFNKASRTVLVQRLYRLFDIYVNDAFPTIHRSQPSIVGFPMVLPSFIGRFMEKELKALNMVLEETSSPCTYIVGGAKVIDRLKMMKAVLERGNADYVLTGGLIANALLAAEGYQIPDKSLPENGQVEELARDIIRKFKDKVLTPDDLLIKIEGKYQIVNAGDHISGKIVDIGENTIEKYSRIIMQSSTVVASGPMGVIEEEKSSVGTRKILEAMAKSKAFKLICGGHMGAVAEIMGIKHEMDHISLGGGATLAYLAGMKMPALEALKESARRKNLYSKLVKKGLIKM